MKWLLILVFSIGSMGDPVGDEHTLGEFDTYRECYDAGIASARGLQYAPDHHRRWREYLPEGATHITFVCDQLEN